MHTCVHCWAAVPVYRAICKSCYMRFLYGGTVPASSAAGFSPNLISPDDGEVCRLEKIPSMPVIVLGGIYDSRDLERAVIVSVPESMGNKTAQILALELEAVLKKRVVAVSDQVKFLRVARRPEVPRPEVVRRRVLTGE